MTYYKLWDVDVGKYIGRYDSERDALDVVSTFVRHYGNDAADDLSLTHVADDGVVLESLCGAALLQRIEERADRAHQRQKRRPVMAKARSRLEGRAAPITAWKSRRVVHRASTPHKHKG
jgi:hypothetical protein